MQTKLYFIVGFLPYNKKKRNILCSFHEVNVTKVDFFCHDNILEIRAKNGKLISQIIHSATKHLDEPFAMP